MPHNENAKVTLDEKALDAAIASMREPYPVRVFPSLDDEQRDEINDLLHKHGYSLDRISAQTVRVLAPSLAVEAICAYLSAISTPAPSLCVHGSRTCGCGVPPLTASPSVGEDTQDAKRWRYVRDKIEVSKDRTLANTVRPVLTGRLGHTCLPDGTPTKWDKATIEESIDAAMGAVADKEEVRDA